MGKMFPLLAVVLLLGMSGEGRGETPHQAARRCFDRFTADCDKFCAICHLTIGIAPPAVKSIGDYYPDVGAEPQEAGVPLMVGDIPLCMGCHFEKFYPGLNHPVGIRYAADLWQEKFRAPPEKSLPVEYGDRDFIPPPRGPKLFCDETGGECWIFCSTCHDPHQGEDRLLRRPAAGASLCLYCHRK